MTTNKRTPYIDMYAHIARYIKQLTITSLISTTTITKQVIHTHTWLQTHEHNNLYNNMYIIKENGEGRGRMSWTV